MDMIDDKSPEDGLSNEINIDGFKIQIGELIKENLLPDFFNTPLIGQWEITRECNLRCIFCYNNSGKKLPNELTHDEKKNIAQQIVNAKIYRMCISGGEPILCPSYWNIAKIFKEGKILCNTISNGWNINEENAPLFTKYFDSIQISIDGSKKETHDKLRCKKGSWEKAVNACRLIKRNNGIISIATVATPANFNEIEKIIDLAYSLDAVCISIDEAKCTGRAANNIDDVMLSKNQSILLNEIVNKKKIEYTNTPFLIELIPKTQYNYVRGYAKIPPVSIYISPSGVCAVDPVIPFSGGSLRKKSLIEIWNYLKTCHENEEFISMSLKVKTSKDFKNLNKIPYVNGELHD